MTASRPEPMVKHKALAQWLQDHTNMLGHADTPRDESSHQALYEGIINATRQGETRLLDSVLENAAAQAVAVGRSLPDLLNTPRQLCARIRQRIVDEVDPEPALDMLTAVNDLFDHISGVIISTYQEAYQLSHVDRAVEISRIYAETEEKVMQYAAEVARANRELARLEKAKTDFISIAAHELKTPLTLIHGYVNMLHNIEISPQIAALLTGIQRGAERMGDIIENMLDLSAIDTQQLKLILTPVNLKSLIELIITQQREALQERRQNIETINLETLPVIEADQNRLHQVFTHLINNAIKYTPDGGKITIIGEMVRSDNDAGPDKVRLMVKDTGVGIAPEDREKIFERFHRVGDSKLHSSGQTKFMGAGPGLGLAIVKGLVEAHGGRVWADSPGFDIHNFPGSTFNVVLPVVAMEVRRSNFQKLKPFATRQPRDRQR